jgi:Spy/CpxP family protein refolding chaperone
MKTIRIILKTVTVILLTGMIVTTVSAQNGGQMKVHKDKQTEKACNPNSPNSPPSPPPPPPPPPPPDLNDETAPPHLDLPGITDEQKEQIRKADLKTLETITPLRNELREKKARLATIMSTNPVDLNGADKVAEDIGKIQASILKARIRHDQELRKLLTPDQQILFDARPKPFLQGKPGR